MKAGGRQGWFVILTVLSVGIVVAISGCGNSLQVQGLSMEPTIKDGQRITIDRNAYREAAPQRGDIIVHERDNVKFARRVIGLGRETVTIRDGAVFVSGNKLNEPYLASDERTESATKEFRVPENSYFVLGDNRDKSLDSRSYGFIPRDQIIAKVVQ